VSITHKAIDAYLKRNTNESKEILLRYYQTMVSIQSETVNTCFTFNNERLFINIFIFIFHEYICLG
jgi:hypothetical protein